MFVDRPTVKHAAHHSTPQWFLLSRSIADFHDLYISSDEKLFNKMLTCPNHILYGHSCHQLLHEITVLKTDLTIDSYLPHFSNNGL